ncbi:MAG: PfkB family carbohydrate kinase [Geodermatophilaceae bacterium]
MSPTARVVIVGNLTIDDVVLADGTTYMGTLGGNSVHAATAAHANGSPTTLVARKGADFPDAALRRLAQAGIDLTHLRSVDGPTVRNWVIYEADGRRHWCYRTDPARSRVVAPQPVDLPAQLLTVAAVVHLAAMPLPNAEALAAHVRQARPEAIITVDTHEDWVEGYRERLFSLACSVDVFVPSWEELTVLTGTPDVQAGIAALAAGGVARAVVKAGAQGAFVLDSGRVSHLPSAAREVTDTTGAGDTFCGALAAGLAQGLELTAAARLGCATAAVAIGSVGSLRLLDKSVPAEARGQVADPARTDAAPRPPADPYQIDVMHREIQMIPQVISKTVADPSGVIDALVDEMAREGVEHLWLTGCGDSAFAGQAAGLAFQRHSGLTPHPVHAIDLARYHVRYLPPRSAVIALSFSGRVGRTTEAALQARRFGHRVIALTNNSSGPLAQASESILPIDVPTLGFSPGTSTYVGMLATLLRLAAGLARRRGNPELLTGLDAIPGLAEKTLLDCAEPARVAASALWPATWVAFLGAGPNEATARFGAAKLFEGPQQVGVSTNLEEWAHEEYFVTGRGDPVVLVDPSGASHDRAMEILDELRFIQARPIVVSDVAPGRGALHVPLAPGVSEELSPLLACLPLSLIGFHLARLCGKESYNFPSEAAKAEHYETIHRVTVGWPA